MSLERSSSVRSVTRQWWCDRDARYKVSFLLFAVPGVVLYPPDQVGGGLYYVLISAALAFSAGMKFSLRYFFPLSLVLIIFAGIPALTAVAGLTDRSVSHELVFGGMVALKTLSIVLFILGLGNTLTASETFAVLRWFRLPAGIIFLLLVGYRYFQLFTSEVRNILEARQLRLYERSALTGIVGALRVLLHRAFDHAEDVYMAMRLRGGESSIPLLKPLHASGSDPAAFSLLLVLIILPFLGML